MTQTERDDLLSQTTIILSAVEDGTNDDIITAVDAITRLVWADEYREDCHLLAFRDDLSDPSAEIDQDIPPAE